MKKLFKKLFNRPTIKTLEVSNEEFHKMLSESLPEHLEL